MQVCLRLVLLLVLVLRVQGQNGIPQPYLGCAAGYKEVYRTDFGSDTSYNIEGLNFGFSSGESRPWSVTEEWQGVEVNILGAFDLQVDDEVDFAFTGLPEGIYVYNIHYAILGTWDGHNGQYGEYLEFYHGSSVANLELEFTSSFTCQSYGTMCFPNEYPCGGDAEAAADIDDENWKNLWFTNQSPGNNALRAGLAMRSVGFNNTVSDGEWVVRVKGVNMEAFPNEGLGLYKVQLCMVDDGDESVDENSDSIDSVDDATDGLSGGQVAAVALGSVVIVGALVGLVLRTVSQETSDPDPDPALDARKQRKESRMKKKQGGGGAAVASGPRRARSPSKGRGRSPTKGRGRSPTKTRGTSPSKAKRGRGRSPTKARFDEDSFDITEESTGSDVTLQMGGEPVVNNDFQLQPVKNFGERATRSDMITLTSTMAPNI